MLWGIRYHGDDDKWDWVREHNIAVSRPPILAFESKRAACKRAAEYAGYASYTEAKRDNWVEVKPLTEE
jgi:hypothetical protein